MEERISSQEVPPRKTALVEEHGVDPVPRPERTRSWWDLFVILAGVNIALSSFLVGGILVPGLSWYQACAALALGNLLLGGLAALMGYMGVDLGIPASVASRISLGYPKGTWLASLCILVSLVGWFAVTAEIGGVAVDGLVKSVTGFSSPVLMIGLVGVSNALVAVAGFAFIRKLSVLSVPLLLVLSVWLVAAIGNRYDLGTLVRYRATGDVGFFSAVDWVVGALIVGVFVASDITRYVRSRGHAWVGSILGILPVSALLGGIGALANLATGDWNPVNAVQAIGMGMPALFIIVFSTWTTNDVNLYCAGLALTNLFPRAPRWRNTVLLSAVGTLLAMLRITEHLRAFLELLTYSFSPLVGVVMCDYFLVRRTRPSLKEAYTVSGRYFYWRGINSVGWFSAAVGIFVGVITPSQFLASISSMAAAGLSYFFGMKLVYPLHFAQKSPP